MIKISDFLQVIDGDAIIKVAGFGEYFTVNELFDNFKFRLIIDMKALNADMIYILIL